MIELGNYYEVGNGRCVYAHSRQYCYDCKWQGYNSIPQSENLARLMINIQYRTAEVLLSPLSEVWKSNQRNAIEIQTDNRKSDTLIVL